MTNYRKLWFLLVGVLIVTFCILGYFGREVYRHAPPIPVNFINQNGDIVWTKEEIQEGQSAWRSTGGMQLGSVLGHGAYQAPDWSADWLHRELTTWLAIEAQNQYQISFEQLSEEQHAALKRQLKNEYRRSKVNEQGNVVLSDSRIKAMNITGDYYNRLYGADPALKKSRESFAMKDNTLPRAKDRKHLTAFFFWTSWITATNRPDTEATYTNNWPHEPLIDNVPTTENIMWSVASVVILLAGIGFLIWGWSFLHKEGEEPRAYDSDPISKITLTPSQKSLSKYLFLVLALFVVQVFLGGFVAHYTVEGQQFYGIDVSQWFPYALVRTWHIQSALFWIATGFLSVGLFLAPIINGGKDPKYQRLGVNLLFCALLILVVGSYIGQYVALAHMIPLSWNFWFGHQGYEFIDLGRFWQIILYVGLLFWLLLMLRGVLPAFKRQGGDKNLLAIFCASVIAIGLFYGAGLFYGSKTNLAVMEYWRWWVVHLWVEGFFEVFATASIAFVFVSLGLINQRLATAATLASATLFMLGGIPGTFHHLYFTGTTTPVMAIGAVFSALEVVPLIIMGYEAWENWSLNKRAPWMLNIRWVMYCFLAVTFWNMLGAGVFGFMINPPISLFYLQGLNTTAVHAHSALFGVYGFLALGFVLLVLRYIRPDAKLNEKWMKIGFWSINLGLVLMIAISLLPIGIEQVYASISQGLWYARSEEFMQRSLLQNLRWLRTIGDVVFIVGALVFFVQVTLALIRKGGLYSKS